MHKNDRHALIKTLITNHVISNQEGLLKLLKEHGVKATQATISRDIRDLKIVKTADADGNFRFELFQTPEKTEIVTEEERLIKMIGEVVTKVESVNFLTIIHTLPDNASLLSSIIDEIIFPDIVCTLAGFDTVVIISRDDLDAKKIEGYFNQYVIL